MIQGFGALPATTSLRHPASTASCCSCDRLVCSAEQRNTAASRPEAVSSTATVLRRSRVRYAWGAISQGSA